MKFLKYGKIIVSGLALVLAPAVHAQMPDSMTLLVETCEKQGDMYVCQFSNGMTVPLDEENYQLARKAADAGADLTLNRDDVVKGQREAAENIAAARAELANSGGATSDSRYFKGRYTGLYTARTSSFTRGRKFDPEYMVVERRGDGSLYVHSEIAECSGPLVPKSRDDMLKPFSQNMSKNPVTGRPQPRSLIANSMPEFYAFGADCPTRELSVYTAGRTPRAVYYFVRPFESDRNGELIGNGRTLAPVNVASSDLGSANRLTRAAYLEELEQRSPQHFAKYPDERDHSDMVMAEYAPFIGKPATTRIGGKNIFEFGHFRIQWENTGFPFRRDPTATYSEVRRVGEAIVVKENEGTPREAAIIVAPYPYGRSTAKSLAGAIFGVDPNKTIKSDYHMRQLMICRRTPGLLKNLASFSYFGSYQLNEQLPSKCEYTTVAGIQQTLGHFESGGQAKNRDRRSILTRIQGSEPLTNLIYRCEEEKPEFTVYRGAFIHRGSNGHECDIPSEPLSSLYP